MKRNETLTHLALIMEKCNDLNLPCERAINHYGECIKELADDAIVILKSILSKPEIRTCRISLVIDFKKMKKLDYWLSSKIFNDLSAARSKELEEKFIVLTNLIFELEIKKKKVDPQHAKQFFKRMMNRVERKQLYLDYDSFRADPDNLTEKKLLKEQIQLTYEVLVEGVLDFDDPPSTDETEEVRLDLVKRGLILGTEMPENFIIHAAKIRRYSYWIDNMFMINHDHIYTKLYQYCFEKMTKRQRMKLLEYNVQMNKLHEDLAMINPNYAKYLYGANNAGSLEDTIYFAPYLGIKMMLQQKWFKTLRSDEKYDAKWADKFAEGLMRSEYGMQIAEEWKEKNIQIKGYIIGCLKNAGGINPKLSNDAVAREAGVMDKWRSFGRYIGKESQEQPYAEWILSHVNEYC